MLSRIEPDILGNEPDAALPQASPAPVQVAQVGGAVPVPKATMPDFDKIDKNLQYLSEQKASPEHVQKYLDSEGVTVEQVVNAKKSYLQRAGEAISGAADYVEKKIDDFGTGIADAYRGQVDPKYKDVPGFNMEGLANVDALNRVQLAKVVAPEDKNYGEIIKKTLGDRLVKAEKDMHGQEIITYRGDDGKEIQTYINKPGLDYEDVDRGVGQALPYIAGGAAVGAAVKGLPFLGRLFAQTTTAGGTSIVGDVTAEKIGSEDGIDLKRAGITAAGGAVGEVLTPVGTALWRKLFARPAMIDAETGGLSASGRKYAEEIGLTPEQIAAMDPQTAKNFSKAGTEAADPGEVAASFRTGEFGVPTTKGQRTKSPQLLQMEVEMRKGLWGKDAQALMTKFDKDQATAIGEAVNTKIGKQIAPEQSGREKATLGQSIHEGMQTAKAYMDEAENILWGRVGPAHPKDEGFDLLAKRINDELNANNVRPKANLGESPQTRDMLQLLEDWHTAIKTGGKEGLQEKELPLIGAGKSSIFLDDIRRRLLGMYRTAGRGSFDELTAKHVYNGFNKWIDDLSEKALLLGKPDTAAALKTARSFTKEMHQLFEPQQGGTLTPAGQRLKTVMQKADSPEAVVDALIPNATTRMKVGDVDVLRRAKEILVDNGQREAWDDIRLAYWVKIAQNGKGETVSPKILKNRIDEAFTNQRTALDILYDKNEKSLIKRFAASLEDATWVDPNPSGTSYALQSMRDRFGEQGSMMKTLLQTQSKRELFSKHNVMMSRIYALLAKKFPISPFGAKEAAGQAAAARQVGQDVTKARPQSLGPFGAGIAAELENE